MHRGCSWGEHEACCLWRRTWLSPLKAHVADALPGGRSAGCAADPQSCRPEQLEPSALSAGSAICDARGSRPSCPLSRWLGAALQGAFSARILRNAAPTAKSAGRQVTEVRMREGRRQAAYCTTGSQRLQSAPAHADKHTPEAPATIASSACLRPACAHPWPRRSRASS